MIVQDDVAYIRCLSVTKQCGRKEQNIHILTSLLLNHVCFLGFQNGILGKKKFSIVGPITNSFHELISILMMKSSFEISTKEEVKSLGYMKSLIIEHPIIYV
jgi:hypothetical protein